MKIIVIVGHSKLANGSYTSANGVINEYLYNKDLVSYVAKYLKELGHTVDVLICPEGEFTKSTQEKDYKLEKVNNGTYNLCAELHLNAFNKSANGSEVYYFSDSGKIYAERVQKKLSTIFRDRGIKKNDNLYILRRTRPTAILIESFFCDNEDDCAKGKDKDVIGRLIAEGIAGKDISDTKPVIENNSLLYKVQCGAFKSKSNAQALKNMINAKGYSAIVVYRGGFYKVQAGAFSIKANATKLSNELTKEGIKNIIILS